MRIVLSLRLSVLYIYVCPTHTFAQISNVRDYWWFEWEGLSESDRDTGMCDALASRASCRHYILASVPICVINNLRGIGVSSGSKVWHCRLNQICTNKHISTWNVKCFCKIKMMWDLLGYLQLGQEFELFAFDENWRVPADALLHSRTPDVRINPWAPVRLSWARTCDHAHVKWLLGDSCQFWRDDHAWSCCCWGWYGGGDGGDVQVGAWIHWQLVGVCVFHSILDKETMNVGLLAARNSTSELTVRIPDRKKTVTFSFTLQISPSILTNFSNYCTNSSQLCRMPLLSTCMTRIITATGWEHDLYTRFFSGTKSMLRNLPLMRRSSFVNLDWPLIFDI